MWEGRGHSKLQKEYEEHFPGKSKTLEEAGESRSLLLPKDYLGDGRKERRLD